MGKVNVNIVTIFRQRIQDSIYSFDVMAVDSNLNFSILVGSIVYNIRRGKIVSAISKSLTLSQEEEKLLMDNLKEQVELLEEKIFS